MTRNRRILLSLFAAPALGAVVVAAKCAPVEDAAPAPPAGVDAGLSDGGDAAVLPAHVLSDAVDPAPSTAPAVVASAPSTAPSTASAPAASVALAAAPELEALPVTEPAHGEERGVVIEARVDRGRRTWALALVDQAELFYAALAARDGLEASDAMRDRMDALVRGEGAAERARALTAPLGLEESRLVEAAMSTDLPTFVVRLVELERRADPGGVETFERLRSLELARDVVLPTDAESDCRVPSEVRARDVDGDGEIEIVVVFGSVLLDELSEREERECVTFATIYGEGDLAPQLAIERERVYYRLDAWSEFEARTDRVFVFRDLDGDGHADVRLTEIAAGSEYEGPDDCDGDGHATPEHRARHRTRVSWECPWDPGRDVWACPPEARLAAPAR